MTSKLQAIALHRTFAALGAALLTCAAMASAVVTSTSTPSQLDEGVRFDAEVLVRDFDALYAGLLAAHANPFARRSRDELERMHAQLRAQIREPMTLAQAQVLFQRFVAHGRVAHAAIDFPAEAWRAFRRRGGKALPVFPRFDGSRFLVADAYVPGLPVGAQVTALDGEPIEAWFRRLRAHVSADTDDMARAMLELRWPAMLWLEIGERKHFTVEWIDAKNQPRTTRVTAMDQATLQELAARTDAPERPPRALQLRDDGIAVLRPGPFFNIDPASADPFDPTAFVAFVDDAFDRLINADARAVLIDLRDNPGGNSTFSDPLVAWFADRPFRFASRFRVKSSEAARASNLERLQREGTHPSRMSVRYEALYAKHPPGTHFDVEWPAVEPRAGRRFEGAVYVLVNRHSYSNATTLAALVQDHGFARVLGEETTDLATTYAAVEHFTLPSTGIRVAFPKAYIVRPSGDTAVRGVVPDVAIRTSIGPDAWQQVLDQAVRIMKRELSERPTK